jgi:hypothetical protein
VAGCCERGNVAQVRDRWRAVVNAVMWLRLGTGGGLL